MTRYTLLAACAAACFVAPIAAAQATTDANAGQAAPADQTAGGAQDLNAADIVVTAQGRAQALADVPVAISAVNADSLALSGANDIRQLNQLAPSLLVTSTGSEANGSPRIRGIGTVGDNPGLESSVVVLIDGVYRSRAGIGLNELGEIDRVEVLRGPQGTLGGRNSSAGLISVVSKRPSFTFGANGEVTYGNFDFWRLAAGVTGPISETLAFRLDGVYVKRDGFYNDRTNDTTINDRDRFFGRAQLVFEPTDAISFRLIGDYTKRDESCCAATYVSPSMNEFIGNLTTPVGSVNAGVAAGSNGNNIINVLRDLGQNLGAFNQNYSRDVSVTPGRSYGGKMEDWGVSGQLDWDFGGVKLTSITAYRDYYNTQAGDVDYGTVDILYNANDGNNRRQFRTFTQELRLNGSAFGDKLDWLIGGFFMDEKYRGRSNLRFGSQYGRFATCRLISGGGLAALYNPAAAGCVASQAAFSGAFGAAGAPLLASLLRLDGLNDRGSTVDFYNQNTTSFAAFTHNIIHITDTFDLTLGLRYTKDKKRFSATFGNDNVACTQNQAALTPFLTNTALAAVAGGIIGLSCQGNSTAELNGVSIADERSEDEFTGTAIASWKPIDDLLVYGSYSRGYKAGGFNFDRSALKAPTLPFASFGGGSAQAGAQALARNLQFDAETVNAFEIGFKYATGPFSLSAAAFRQDFSNFQLNTFDGTVFIVENVNGCSSSLGGGDRDQSKFTAAPNYNAAAATTGACPSGDVGYGVRSQGVELEATLVPIRDFRVTAGMTYADTKFREQLVGRASGAPLNQALRKLPGQQLSLAAPITVTGSVAFTPDIGSSGLSALFYVDTRLTGDYNTGSDLFPQKVQDGFALVNARVGIRGPSERWAVELWAQNIFNKDYAQVAFNSPFQEGANTAAFQDPQYPGGRQIFSNFLAEPRTYGVTLRGRF
ncbi:TonB-dependent receptor [Sphingomonas ginsenosidimutans]|uniref:TonB-dependent receptor n=3 Tax=Pseudomonadota TaxID=1224 RepID=A0A2A4I4X8_9SPHN|nr:TonB-dependent receptor [Sphingomonas ginsenosidimutans]PCG10967.1 TonB-dependent receptor [Sphingomonas ginsenosidimutans]